MTPLCLQYDLIFSMFRGQEDCLFLNIHTPVVKNIFSYIYNLKVFLSFALSAIHVLACQSISLLRNVSFHVLTKNVFFSSSIQPIQRKNSCRLWCLFMEVGKSLLMCAYTCFSPTQLASWAPDYLPFRVNLHFFHLVCYSSGLFMFGGNREFYGGRYFMDEDVVFISLNYRLGLLGMPFHGFCIRFYDLYIFILSIHVSHFCNMYSKIYIQFVFGMYDGMNIITL